MGVYLQWDVIYSNKRENILAAWELILSSSCIRSSFPISIPMYMLFTNTSSKYRVAISHPPLQFHPRSFHPSSPYTSISIFQHPPSGILPAMCSRCVHSEWGNCSVDESLQGFWARAYWVLRHPFNFVRVPKERTYLNRIVDAISVPPGWPRVKWTDGNLHYG